MDLIIASDMLWFLRKVEVNLMSSLTATIPLIASRRHRAAKQVTKIESKLSNR